MMRSRFILLAATLSLLVCPAAGARAEVFNALGRYLGVGWSDGYHARDACCPGPVWAMRKGRSPSWQHHHAEPQITPYFESFPAPAYQPAPQLAPQPLPSDHQPNKTPA